MKWRKQGLLYAPAGTVAWAKRYAFPPTPHAVNEKVLRIYVAFCDDSMVGRIGFVEVDADNPSRVLRVSSDPVLDIGAPGAFDENGVVPTSIVRCGNELYLYYVGFQIGLKVRYYQFQGLAISRDGGLSFQRHSRVPIIDRSDRELLNRTSAFVLRDNGTFKMWYVAGDDWVESNGKMLPRYNLRYLESPDGKTWAGEGRICLDFDCSDEHAFGRPWVLKEQGLYRLFYSVRTYSKGYRLGYAESSDGLVWRRRDDAIGLDISPSGWDSTMIAYSSLFQQGDQTYLFYNGNNCGETGFGYAILDRS